MERERSWLKSLIIGVGDKMCGRNRKRRSRAMGRLQSMRIFLGWDKRMKIKELKREGIV